MNIQIDENAVQQIGYSAAEQFARRLAERSDDFEPHGDEVWVGRRSMVREYGSPMNGANPFLLDEMVNVV